MNDRKLPSTEKFLTLLQQRFIESFLEHGDHAKAYAEHFSVARKSKGAIEAMGRRLLKQPHIERALIELKAKRGEKLMFEVRDVMQEWFDIATADPNELISVHNDACRYCHGIDHRYQWRDMTEYFVAVAAAQREKGAQMPSMDGGIGYRFTADPHPDCPQCEGRGTPTVILRDTSKLSKKARKLYAGVKQTKDGIQILMRDQDAALANMAKAFGMFAEVVKLEANIRAAKLEVKTDDPQEAARLYQELMKGA